MPKLGSTSYKQTKFGILPRDEVIKLEVQGAKKGLQTLQKIAAWYESLQIARKLVSGELVNPTTATHFHGVGVTKEWFIEHVVPKGKFLKKIDDTYFYSSPN